MTPDLLTPEQTRERLEADVLAVARAVGDAVFSRPHLLPFFDTDALQRVLYALLDQHVEALTA